MMAASGLFDIVMTAAIVSFAVSMLIVLTQGWHGPLSLDQDVTSAQKFHKKPVPRIGGIALLLGMLATFIWSAVDNPQLARQVDANAAAFTLLLAAVPAFLAGLKEDLTKKVSVRTRLFATFASALLACWLLEACLPRLDIWGLDKLLHFVPFAIVLTVFAVAGVANSINIIDGFHGVAGSAVIIILAGLGFLCWQVDDLLVTGLALAGIGTTLGFLLVNYPTGRLFMGDGGAYLLGFWVAEVAVLTIVRNPAINAWQVLAICAYPVIEVLYSIYRRKVVRNMSPGAPDRLHLHTLIYRRVVCQRMPRNNAQPWIRNATVACIVGTGIAMTTLIAVWVGNSIPAAVTVVIVEILLYMAVYTRLIRGRWGLSQVSILRLAAARSP